MARTNDVRDSQGLAIELPGVENAADYVSQTYTAEAPTFDAATHWSQFLVQFEDGAGASATSTAADWAGNNAEAAFAFDLHDVLGDGLVYSGLQIGPASTAAPVDLNTAMTGDSDQQWFRFTTVGQGTSNSSVTLTSDASAGTLTFTLDSLDPTTGQTTQIAAATTSQGSAALSLNDLRPASISWSCSPARSRRSQPTSSNSTPRAPARQAAVWPTSMILRSNRATSG